MELSDDPGLDRDDSSSLDDGRSLINGMAVDLPGQRRKKPYITLLIWVCAVGYVAFIWGMVTLAEGNLPSPLPATAVNTSFAEGRAFAILQDLVNISYDAFAANRTDGNSPLVGRIAFEDSALKTVDYILLFLCKTLHARQSGITDNCTAIIDSNGTSHAPLPWREFVILADGTHVLIDVRAAEHAFQQTPDSPVYLSYASLVNIVVVISSSRLTLSTATVVSAHYDSTFYSPGASDNGANVAVLMELYRLLLVSTPSAHATVLLFNEAEECGLMGADAFVNTHPSARNVKSVINLDSGGGWGQLALTQLGPQNAWLAKAYQSSIPHPYGNSLASDVFSSGVVPSGTDFEIFRRAGIVGVDCVFIKNGWHYHTGLDDLDDYVPGSLQHAGDNVYALLQAILYSNYMAGEPDLDTRSVWVDILTGAFVAFDTPVSVGLLVLNVGLSILLAFWLLFLFKDRYPGKSSLAHHLVIPSLIGFAFVLLSILSGIVFALAAGAVVGSLNTFAWYADIPFAVFMFGSWSVLGMALAQIGFRRLIRRFERSIGSFILETLCCVGVATLFLILHGSLAIGGFGASIIFFWWTLFFLLAVIPYALLAKWTFDPIRAKFFRYRVDPRDFKVWFPFYLVWTLLPLFVTLSTAWRTAVAFTPFMARFGITGDSVILDVLYAGLISVLVTLLLLPLVLGLSHRAQHRWKTVLVLAVIAIVLLAVGCTSISPYTGFKPRRVDVTHYCDLGSVNISTLHSVSSKSGDWVEESPDSPSLSMTTARTGSLLAKDGKARTPPLAGSPQCILALGAPNPGSLSPVVDALHPAFPFTVPCEYPAYKYQFQPALCLDQTVMPLPAPSVPAPSISVQSVAQTTAATNVTLTIAAANASVWFLRFSGSNSARLVSWSLDATVPPLPTSSWSKYLYTGYQYGLIHRTRLASTTLWLCFAGQLSGLDLDLVTSSMINTPLQAQVVAALPDWARTWGKSNNPGPFSYHLGVHVDVAVV